MRDGVEIAVTVDLPPDLKVGERVPVLMRTTRHWRAPKIGWVLRMLVDPVRYRPLMIACIHREVLLLHRLYGALCSAPAGSSDLLTISG
jgi:hypothetical protein